MSLNNPLLDFSNHPLFDAIKPEHIAPALDQLLPAADAALETVTAADFPAEWKAIAAVLDVATEMRLEKRKEDFGQTLGRWGVKPGPYIVLPILGPSTLRDTLAAPLDIKGDVVQQFNDPATRNVLSATRVMDVRSGLLESIDVIKAAALDPYTFVRDGYLQKRENDVYDGNPPSTFDYTESEAP